MTDAPGTSDYPEAFKKKLADLTRQWKRMLKKQKKLLLKCPNHEKCHYKCGSLGGMQYHYPRCAGVSPVFKCITCDREYESKTGLNYHSAAHHSERIAPLCTITNDANSLPSGNKSVSSTTPSPPLTSPSSVTTTAPPIITATSVSVKPATSVPATTVPTTIPTKPVSIKPAIAVATKPAIIAIKPTTTVSTSSAHTIALIKPNVPVPSIVPTTSSSVSNTDGKPVKRKRGRPPGRTNAAKVDKKETTEIAKNKTVAIPSIEEPEENECYVPEWVGQLNINGVIECPNYDECQYHCSTVSGIKYHFWQCQQDKLPRFQCSLCLRSFHCRSGLVWHLKLTHKISAVPINQKRFEIIIAEKRQERAVRANTSKEEVVVEPVKVPSRRGRKKKGPENLNVPPPTVVHERKSLRKNQYPRRTAEFFLKEFYCPRKYNHGHISPTLWYGSPPPTPRLHTPPCLSPIAPTEFHILDKVPTDQHKYGSTEVEFSEELLTQWHKWYSDSEDSDYEGDEERDDSLGIDRYVSDFSSSTSEDASSDEDYCGYSYKPVRGGGERRGRGRRRCTIKDTTYQPTQPASPLSSSPSPVAQLPPPLISHSEVPPPEVKVQKMVPVSPPVKIVSPVKDFKPAVPDLVPIKSVKHHSPVKPVVISSSAHSTSSGLVQYYQVPSGVQSLVPIQLVQSPTYSAPPGSVIMLQPAGGGRAQRVSVIMNPRPPSSPSTSYITQLDGPPPQHHLPTTSSRLQDEFETMRKRARIFVDQQDQLLSHNAVTPICRGAKRKIVKTPAPSKDTSSPPPPIGPPQKKRRKVDSSNGGEGGEEGEHSGYQCKECAMAFPTVAGLRGHSKTVHSAPLRKILPKTSSGKGCGHKGDIHTAAKVHNQSTQTYDEKPSKHKASSTKNGTQKKLKMAKKFSCPTCAEGYDSSPNLMAHMFAVHAKLPDTASVSDKARVWRKILKVTKILACDKCNDFTAKSVESLKYHYERCGVSSKLEFKCDVCGKIYTTKPGLEYHAKGHRMPVVVVSTPEPSSPLDHIMCPRKAALSATDKIREIAPEEITKCVDVELNARMKELKRLFLVQPVVECPTEGCTLQYKSYKGLQYHLEHGHQEKKMLQCPLCPMTITTRKRMTNHIVAKHPGHEVDVEGLEFVVANIQTVSEDEAEEFESPKKPATKSSKPYKIFGTTSYQRMVEIVRETTCASSDCVHRQWRPRVEHVKLLSPNERECHLPLQQTSMTCSCRDNGIDDEDFTISLFGSRPDKGLLFAGGPVWAMDWMPHPLPSDSSVTYVVMVAHKSMDEFNDFSNLIIHKGLIQLWTINGLSNASKKFPTSSFSLGLAHNWGVVKCVKWCPSGSCDHSDDVIPEGYLPRLGLIAVACTDGYARIISLPHPPCLTQSLHTNIPAIVGIDAVSALLAPAANGRLMGQCLAVQWIPRPGHNKIAAAFASGVVTIWNVEKCISLPYLHSTTATAEVMLYPTTTIKAHSDPCRCIAWSPIDTNIMFIGTSRKFSLWDLSQPDSQMMKVERTGVVNKMECPLVWPCLFFSEDDGRQNCVHLFFLSNRSVRAVNLSSHDGPTSSIVFSDWDNRLTIGTYLGEVCSKHVTHSYYTPSYKEKSKESLVFRAHVEKIAPLLEGETDTYKVDYRQNCISDLVKTHKIVFENQGVIAKGIPSFSNDILPVTAVTSICNSPHSSFYKWYACALNCGLVKFIKLDVGRQNEHK